MDRSINYTFSVHRCIDTSAVAFFWSRCLHPIPDPVVYWIRNGKIPCFFYPNINILSQFCLQKIMTGLLHTPKPWGGLYYNQYSASPKMGWVAKNDKKCWPPLPLGASASLTWNEDACALWAASHPPFEGWKSKVTGETFPKIVMLIRRGAFYQYNIMYVYIYICIYHTKK